MKKVLLLAAAIVATISLHAADIPQCEVRKTQNFNSDWRFILSDRPEFRDPSYNDKKWRELTLPHDWSIESDYTPDFAAGRNNGFFSEGLGWYRKSFTLPESSKNKQFVIQFDGVYMNSEVWINGKYLGRRPYGYSTFRYDLTDYLNFGDKENIIAVRVDNSNPGGDRWYHGSGIYRDVFLIETSYVHFKHNGGVYVTTPMAEEALAVVNVDYELIGSYFSDDELKTHKKNGWLREQKRWRNEPKAHECIIRSIIYDSNGNEVAREQQNNSIINYEVDYKTSLQLNIPSPQRWSDKSPNLYYLKSQIEYDGKILDDVVTRFGVRKLEMRANEGLFVNGEMVKLKGVCLHHDAGALGAAVPKKSYVYRLEKLKEMGCNAIRTAHNPPSTAFLEVCDSLGFYVKNETIDEWTCGWAVNFTENPTGKSMNGYFHLFEQWAETDIRDLVKRDRNHPSVIIYTVGNEIPNYRHFPSSVETLKRLVGYCKEEDPTRPVCIGDNAATSTYNFGIQDELDILGFNYIERDGGLDIMYDRVHELNPSKLTFGSETSKEIIYFLEMRDKDYVVGQFVWTGIDYLGEVRKAPQRGWNTSLLDMTLHMRWDGAMFSSCWNDEPKAYITSSPISGSEPLTFTVLGEAGERVAQTVERDFTWNWEDSEDKYVIIYNNCDEIELLQDGKSLGRKENDFSTYFVEFKVPYRAGKLEAIGYRDGKRVTSDIIETTSQAAAIKAVPVWTSMKRDGADINIIEIDIVDSEGRTVPDAKNNVKVKVSGGGKLIALDSPNLIYEGNFKVDNREAERGHLMVTVQSNGEDLPTTITLSSKGLEGAKIEF